MAEITVEFNVYCSCGEELDTEVQDASVHNRWQTSVTVEPCEKCAQRREDVGYDKGVEEGERNG